MTKTWPIALLPVATVMVSGCVVLKINGRGARPVLLNTPTAGYDVRDHFKENVGQCLAYTHAPDLSPAIAEVLKRTKADALINVGILDQQTGGDLVMNIVTLGFAQCHTTTIEGDAIEFKPEAKKTSLPKGPNKNTGSEETE